MVGDVGKAGWLWKWTNYMQGYQKRWCVITKGSLSYYRNPDEVDTTCRGSLILSGSNVVISNSMAFILSNGLSHIFYFKVNEESELSSWIAAIENEKAKRPHIKNHRSFQTIPQQKSQENEKELSEEFGALGSKRDDLEACLSLVQNYEEDVMKKIGTDEISNSVKTLESSALALCQKKEFQQQDSNPNPSTNLVAEAYKNIVVSLDQRLSPENETSSPASIISAEESDTDSFISATSDDESEDKNEIEIEGKVYRDQIPFRPKFEWNIWKLLKDSIGGELYRLPLPVNFNEPLSMLQRFSEDLEYSHLLDKAAKCSDSCVQMAFVVAFSVAGYSTTRNRVSKPFNPMLGETYEMDRDDRGFTLIAEQVSHHPPIGAIHVESKKGLWTLWTQLSMESKFYGNFFKAIPTSTYHLEFHKTGHHYTWKKVVTNINNIILGRMWIDQLGDSTVINHSTGDKCKHTYTPYNLFGNSNHRMVSGVVEDKHGKPHYLMSGYWDSHMDMAEIINEVKNGSNATYETKKRVRVWTVNPPIDKAEHMYNFTALSITLNQMEEGVAPTDSRLRPDQRQMEKADWDSANKTKLLLEEAQRKRRRERENIKKERIKNGLPEEPYEPKWFKLTHCQLTDEDIYTYQNEYWECKKNKQWDRCVEIFALD